MNKDYEVGSFGHDGYLLVKFNEDDLRPIKDDILTIQNNFDKAKKVKQELAGNLQREYELSGKSKQRLHEIIFPYIGEYNKHFSWHVDTGLLDSDLPYDINKPWVNFQKKHEFNPLHKHAGMYSFVLWIQIPYLIEDEMDSPSVVDSNTKRPGCFEFAYTATMGQIKTHAILADKKLENHMIIFPSTMMHCVYPFYTSDDYRISVAGNYFLTTKYLQ